MEITNFHSLKYMFYTFCMLLQIIKLLIHEGWLNCDCWHLNGRIDSSSCAQEYAALCNQLWDQSGLGRVNLRFGFGAERQKKK